MNSNIQLVIIDPQNDFCDTPSQFLPVDQATGFKVEPSLAVQGAHGDMYRLGDLMLRAGDAIDGIVVTLDTHNRIDIAHTVFWRLGNGGDVAPFTEIPSSKIKTGEITTRNPAHLEMALDYVKQLESTGRHVLRAWPVHCEAGTWGSNVHYSVRRAYGVWEEKYQRSVKKIVKGMNPWTEHYSAVQAEVPDSADPTTQTNMEFVAPLQSASMILVGGEASSHCVAETVRHLVNYVDPKVICLLRDCMSPVYQCEAMAEEFFAEMSALGVRMANADDIAEELRPTPAYLARFNRLIKR